MTTPTARRATRSLRVARKRAAVQAALWALLEGFDGPDIGPDADDVLCALEAALATVDEWDADRPPVPCPHGPVRLVGFDPRAEVKG